MNGTIKEAQPDWWSRSNRILLKKTGFVIGTYQKVRLKKPSTWLGYPCYTRWSDSTHAIGPFVIIRLRSIRKK